MAVVDSMGTSLIVGGQTVFTNYFTENETTGGAEVDSEDINNNDGALATRLIFKRLPTVDLSLICKASAAPATDFPQGDLAPSTAGTYSGWYVDSLAVNKTKSATKVSVKLTSLSLT